MRATVAALIIAGLASAPGAAAEPRSSELLTALVGCKALADDARRLACYDSAAGRLADATAKGEVKVVDRAEVRAARRSLFGFTLPALPFFKGDDSVEATPDEVEAVIASARDLGYSKFSLTMADGAVWQSTEPLPRDPKPGQKVKLKRGAIGSYFMMVNGGRAVRAIRSR